MGMRVRLRVRPIASGSSPIIRRMSPHRPLPTPMLLGSVERLKRPLRMHPGAGSRLVYRQLPAVGGFSFALSKRFESVQITCEQAGKRMEQNRAGGGARRLRIGVTAPQGDGPEGRRVVGRPCGPESRRADQGRSTTKPTLLTAPAAQPPPPAPLGSLVQ